MENNIERIAVVGLGYVGLPLAISFAKKLPVIGFDTNKTKIQRYLAGEDPTNEVGSLEIKNTSMTFTSEAKFLKDADFIIVAVPTPILRDKTPDLNPVISASKLIGANLKPGAIVVFESTVYPGVTEEICIPALEEESGMVCGNDFFVGYSPERINPGDKRHRLENIVKIVSGMNNEVLEIIASTYELIIEAGVHKVSSIKIAEAAKLVENAQRDINIAFMNELAMVFNRMGIPTRDVIEAMNTKWNKLGFYPGLVGGHCIGVDPYYFVYQAEQLGYHSQIIAAGRKVNDDMPIYIAEMILKQMIQADFRIRGAKIYFMGVTFKENCPDIRNSKTQDIINELENYLLDIKVCDPIADEEEVEKVFGKELVDIDDIVDADCLVFTVSHKEFIEMDIERIKAMYNKQTNPRLLIDIRSMFDANTMKGAFKYWSL